MNWFSKKDDKKVKIPEGLWVKCNNCKEIIYRKEVEKNFKVCPKCNYHFPLTVTERISVCLDEGTFSELYPDITPVDTLKFEDAQKYTDRLKRSQERTGQKDTLVIGTGSLKGHKVLLGIFNFSFMGGSMGSVVGEKIARGVEYAVQERLPFILVIASGGARMQEGIISLMQMAKTSAVRGVMKKEKLPFINVLTDPTYGGVTASFAMQGDIILAEPKAMIGFAGPRVIEQTIRQQLPNEFQKAEFLFQHGMIDMIVERKNFKDKLSNILDFFAA